MNTIGQFAKENNVSKMSRNTFRYSLENLPLVQYRNLIINKQKGVIPRGESTP